MTDDIQTIDKELAKLGNKAWEIAVKLKESGLRDATKLCVKGQRILGAVLQLRQDLWNIDPDLVDPRLIPNATIDLSAVAAGLEGSEQERVIAVGQLLVYAPDSVVGEANDTATFSERESIVREWWNSTKKPVSTVEHLDRLLDASQRWRRVHAARILSQLGVLLMNSEGTDVDRGAVQAWRLRRHPT